ncbi:MAG: AlpA family phage regulatory protein [Gammaproteobacteria bacterium]|nr:AlpA family phage regulatory protein [Gammaproteobacteria bacterium]
MDTQKHCLLTRTEVETRCRIGRSTIYRLMRSGEFPIPLRIGPRAVRWVESEIDTWISRQPRASGVLTSVDNSQARA